MRLVEALRLSPVVALSAALAVGCGPTYPNCDNDEQCREGEVCVGGRCQACRDDSQCPEGQQCDQNACVATPGYCNEAIDCPRGSRCERNRCVVSTSTDLGEPTDPNVGRAECDLVPVYFGFDESALDASARAALEANASCIQRRDLQVVLTGMCDPRGTEEYNLALGDRRARTTREHLERLGVDFQRMTPHSVGEEMATGEDESGWRQDRRVTFTAR